MVDEQGCLVPIDHPTLQQIRTLLVEVEPLVELVEYRRVDRLNL
jgi:hypothetical protein